MFNEISPAIYHLLRQRAGLTQEKLASLLDVSRATIVKIESGRTQLDGAQERKLIELAQCSREEFAELACEHLSQLLDKPVMIRNDLAGYQPVSALSKAHSLLHHHGEALPAPMMRALHNKVYTTRLLGMAFERNTADLEELTRDCSDQLYRDRATTVG